MRIKIPKIDERFELWAQMQGVAHWILEIVDDWWNSDVELRNFSDQSYEKHECLYDDPGDIMDDEQYPEPFAPEDDVPF